MTHDFVVNCVYAVVIGIICGLNYSVGPGLLVAMGIIFGGKVLAEVLGKDDRFIATVYSGSAGGLLGWHYGWAGVLVVLAVVVIAHGLAFAVEDASQ